MFKRKLVNEMKHSERTNRVKMTKESIKFDCQEMAGAPCRGCLEGRGKAALQRDEEGREQSSGGSPLRRAWLR